MLESASRFLYLFLVFVFKQKTAYEMRISDWSSDVCSSDLGARAAVDEIDHQPERVPAEEEHFGLGRQAEEQIDAPQDRDRPHHRGQRRAEGPRRIRDRKSVV